MNSHSPEMPKSMQPTPEDRGTDRRVKESFLRWTEDEAISFLVNPEQQGLTPTSREDTWERRVRGRTAVMIGHLAVDGLRHGAQVDIHAPGIVGRALNRISGEKRTVNVFASVSRQPDSRE